MTVHHLILLIVILAAAFFAASWLAVYSYGKFARRARGTEMMALPVAESDTALDQLIAPLLAAHPGKSGLLPVDRNPEAFAVRASLARAAGRSLDCMYYYWNNDLTGKLLARELIAAADRGVRVRLLIDDFNIRGSDRALVAMQSHPQIQVRLFNPIRNSDRPLRRGLELLLRMFTVNRRMHNKAWIADGRAAVIGGRNIGDAYFDAATEANFRDLDLVAVGTAVQQAEAIFDRFWNSPATLRIRALRRSRPRYFRRLRRVLETHFTSDAAKPYLAEIEKITKAPDALLTRTDVVWTGAVEVISDPPEKSNGENREAWIFNRIFATVNAAERNLNIISPYFVPGTSGVATLAAMRNKGVEIAIVTNSLASTDVAAVHGGYAPYRKPLLEAGIALYELRPDARRQRMSLFGSKTASLHTKAFVVDDVQGFVGSFNFDPRSTAINTEMGILFRNAELAKRLLAIIRKETSADDSYQLKVENGALAWIDGRSAPPAVLTKEPATTASRRFIARLVRFLPVESQL